MDITQYIDNNIVSCIIQSSVPEVTKSEPCCLGIDEAGRGPVLGPMVYGICYCPVSMMDKLADLGFADSKTLTEEKRDKLLTVIEENTDFIGWAIKIIAPTRISNDMLGRTKVSLNEISHNAAIELTKKTVEDRANITEMYVDTVGPPETYQEMLKSIFPMVDVTVAKKADSKFPIVSAASICAKVARDRCISNWKFIEGDISREFGSGYPADQAVKNWLRDVMDPIFGFPQLVRFSWSTAYTILDDKAIAFKWDDDEPIDEAAIGTASITSFYAKSNVIKEVKRCAFLSSRHLEQCVDL